MQSSGSSNWVWRLLHEIVRHPGVSAEKMLIGWKTLDWACCSWHSWSEPHTVPTLPCFGAGTDPTLFETLPLQTDDHAFLPYRVDCVLRLQLSRPRQLSQERTQGFGLIGTSRTHHQLNWWASPGDPFVAEKALENMTCLSFMKRYHDLKTWGPTHNIQTFDLLVGVPAWQDLNIYPYPVIKIYNGMGWRRQTWSGSLTLSANLTWETACFLNGLLRSSSILQNSDQASGVGVTQIIMQFPQDCWIWAGDTSSPARHSLGIAFTAAGTVASTSESCTVATKQRWSGGWGNTQLSQVSTNCGVYLAAKELRLTPSLHLPSITLWHVCPGHSCARETMSLWDAARPVGFSNSLPLSGHFRP